jgi:hypothetical protein
LYQRDSRPRSTGQLRSNGAVALERRHAPTPVSKAAVTL